MNIIDHYDFCIHCLNFLYIIEQYAMEATGPENRHGA